MKRVYTFQVTFSKGMIETVKPDAQHEQTLVEGGQPLMVQQQDSVLWLENMNPNLQQESLIRRKSETNVYMNVGAGTILEELNLGFYSPFIAPRAYDATTNTTPSGDFSLQAIERLDIRQPSFLRSIVAFIGRYIDNTTIGVPAYGEPNYQPWSHRQAGSADPTAIANVCNGQALALVLIVPEGDEAHWYESHAGKYNAPGSEALSPGWYIYGWYGDSEVYGETIRFTTILFNRLSSQLQDVNSDWDNYTDNNGALINSALYMRICYVFKYFSLKDKWLNGNHLWRGISAYDQSSVGLGQLDMWKVKVPSLMPNASVGVFFSIDNGTNWTLMQTALGQTATIGTSDIEVLMWKRPLYLLTPFNHVDIDDPMFNEPNYIYNNSFRTFDAIDNPDGNDTYNLPGTISFFTEPNIDRGSGKYVNTDYTPLLHYVAGQLTNNIELLEPVVLPMFNSLITSVGFGAVATMYSIDFNNIARLETKTVDDPKVVHVRNLRARRPVAGTDIAIDLMRIVAPNYIELEIPRLWFAGEKLPIVITKNVGGVNVLIFQDIITFQSAEITHWDNYDISAKQPEAWTNAYDSWNKVSEFNTEDPTLSSQQSGSDDIYHTTQAIHKQMLGVERKSEYIGFIPDALSQPPSAPADWFPLDPADWQTTTVLDWKTEYNAWLAQYEIYLSNVTHDATYDLSGSNYYIDDQTELDGVWASYNNLMQWRNDAITLYNQNADPFNRTCYEMLFCTIRIKQDYADLLTESGLRDISVWFGKPSQIDTIFRTVGVHSIHEPQQGFYPLHSIDNPLEENLSNYALFKRFLIDGKNQNIYDYTKYKGTPTSTNAWRVNGDYYEALPTNDINLATTAGNAVGDVQTSRNISPSGIVMQDYNFTPDFAIWDYPYEDTLILNSSVNYLHGLGAELICVCKGMTFVDGVIDATGSPLNGIFYSVVQNGVIAEDVFVRERVLYVGHNKHVALVNFREQLWVFSRFDMTRIMFNQITDDTTWEYADVIQQGTFDKKTVCETPYGVCWLNSAGLWLSDGGEPQNIGIAVLPTLQRISADSVHQYYDLTSIDRFEVASLSNVIALGGYNQYLSVSYAYDTDEVIVSTPVWLQSSGELPTFEFRAIFSFAYKNWRVERYDTIQ